MNDDFIAILRTRDALVATPAGYLVRFSGDVQAGDLEWSGAAWEPASAVGQPIISLPGGMVARLRKL